MYLGFLLRLKLISQISSIVLDSAATLETETPKVFCGLKHFTPLIGIVMSR